MKEVAANDALRVLRVEVLRAAQALLGDEAQEVDIQLERPPNAEFGDYSTNAALLLAPKLEEEPREVAARLQAELESSIAPQLEKVEVAGPGFVNLFLADRWYKGALAGIAASGARFGANVAARPERINLEFVSANPTGPLHVGHGRHAAFGDSLARVLELAGHKVEREFYINDFGGQIQLFGESIAARRRGQRAPEGGYHGAYIEELARELSGLGADDGVEEVARGGVAVMLDRIRHTLERFRVSFDRWSYESALHREGKVEAELVKLRQRGELYEQEGAIWLRTTDFGDDKDRVLQRSNGEPTYFAADIAYHRQKRSGGYDRLIDVWGADHHGYMRRMQAAYQAMGGDAEQLELLIVQLVQTVERGERAQMSKRKGEFVTLDELIDDIGTDAARFFLLNRSHDTPIDLDLDLARQQSQENPVYYCQYAHARIASILRKAGHDRVERSAEAFDVPDASGTVLHQSEKLLIKRLLEFPEHVAQAAARRETHRFTTYAMETASDFSAFYRDCKVVGAEPESAESFRLQLCLAAASSIARSLGLLGVEAPERM